MTGFFIISLVLCGITALINVRIALHDHLLIEERAFATLYALVLANAAVALSLAIGVVQ